MADEETESTSSTGTKSAKSPSAPFEPAFLTFPPAPNWYSAHAIAACGPVAAYATFMEVVLLWHDDAEGNPLQYPAVHNFRAFPEALGKKGPHHQKPKVEAVALTRDGVAWRLAVASNQGLVRMFTVDCSSADAFVEPTAYKQHTEHKDRNNEPIAVKSCCWSAKNPDILYSGDFRGRLVRWDTKSDEPRMLDVGSDKKSISVIRSCPYLEDVVALGCAGGSVLLVNASGSGKIMRAIKAYIRDDVLGLSWCPKPGNVFDVESKRTIGHDSKEEAAPEKQEESLLAVSSKDSGFTIWSAFTGAKRADFGGGSGKSYRPNQHHNKSWNWNAVHWSSDNATRLYTNGTSNEIVEWDLSRLEVTNGGVAVGDQRRQEAAVLHSRHRGKVVAVVKVGPSVVSIGHDRKVVLHKKQGEEESVTELPAFENRVFCLAAHPSNPRIVAVGTGGDHPVRICRFKHDLTLDDCDAIHVKDNTRIDSLAWHPEQENKLALGFGFGAVGVIENVASRQQRNVNYKRYRHRDNVYNVSWGPRPGVIEGGCPIVLYSVGSKRIMVHEDDDSDKNGANVHDLNDLISAANSAEAGNSPDRSDIAFHRDGAVMALGGTDGMIQVVDVASLKILAKIKSHSTTVQKLAWHPLKEDYEDDAKEAGKEFSMDFWLAVSSSHSHIHVFDLAKHINVGANKENASASGEEPVSEKASPDSKEEATESCQEFITEPDFVLKGHHQRVNDLCWSPKEPGKLLSISYDYSVQIWDVPTCEAVANVGCHRACIDCCLWFDKDLVLSGAQDCSIRGWRISQSSRKIPPRNCEKLAKAKKKNLSLVPKADKSQEVKSEVDSGSPAREVTENGTASPTPATETSEVEEKDFTRVAKRGRSHLLLERNAFALSQAAEKASSASDCLEVLKLRKALEGNEKVWDESLVQDKVHLKVFGSREDAAQLLLQEAENVESEGDLFFTLCNYHGDVGPPLRKWIDSGKRLNEGLVNLAATVSVEVWHKAVVAMAKQLKNDEDYLRAASYYKMINMFTDAVDCLWRGQKFKSAMILARSMYDPNDPDLARLAKDWAAHAANSGNYELAAKAYASGGHLVEAYKILSKRGNDPNALLTSAILAREAGHQDYALALTKQARGVLNAGMEGGDGAGVAKREELMKMLREEFPQVAKSEVAASANGDDENQV